MEDMSDDRIAEIMVREIWHGPDGDAYLTITSDERQYILDQIDGARIIVSEAGQLLAAKDAEIERLQGLYTKGWIAAEKATAAAYEKMLAHFSKVADTPAWVLHDLRALAGREPDE